MLFHARLGVNQFHSWEQLLKIADFFPPHHSNHNVQINSLCTSQHTVPESKHISCSMLSSRDIYDRLFPEKEKQLFAKPPFFVAFVLNLKYSKKILSNFFLSHLSPGAVNSTHDLGEL